MATNVFYLLLWLAMIHKISIASYDQMLASGQAIKSACRYTCRLRAICFVKRTALWPF